MELPADSSCRMLCRLVFDVRSEMSIQKAAFEVSCYNYNYIPASNLNHTEPFSNTVTVRYLGKTLPVVIALLAVVHRDLF